MPDLYTLPATPTSVISILGALEPYLPTCLPVYRRLQFGSISNETRILSTLSPTAIQVHASSATSATTPAPPTTHSSEQWCIAFVDRSRRPETEGWIFGTWEHDEESTPTTQSSKENSENDNDWQKQAAPILRAIVREVGRLGETSVRAGKDVGDKHTTAAAASSSSSAPQVAAAEEQEEEGLTDGAGQRYTVRNEFDKHMENMAVSLFGCLHERTAFLIQDLGLVADGFPVGPEIANNKWVFDRTGARPEDERKLPEGLYWGEVRARDYDLVRSRTAIPRQNRTLRLLPSAALYPGIPEKEEVEPIAWAFLGVDGSLTTLHVEPEYRGRGLAKVLTIKLWNKCWHMFLSSETGGKNDSGERWTHADVLVGNDASNGLCRSIGGKLIYVNYWVRIDSSKV